MKRVAAKFVPKLLKAEQKQLRVKIAQNMLGSTNSDPDFVNAIITGDESWVYEHEPEISLKCRLSSTDAIHR